MLFVFLAGIELDLTRRGAPARERRSPPAWRSACRCCSAAVAPLPLLGFPGWIGPAGQAWQFVLGIGMACAVTALPILVLLMEKLAILRSDLGQRILRYASLDDIAIWGVLAIDPDGLAARLQQQGTSWSSFARRPTGLRKLMPRLPARDRWYVALIWLAGDRLRRRLGGPALHGRRVPRRRDRRLATGSIREARRRCATTCCW
jgi:hypothetical protein